MHKNNIKMSASVHLLLPEAIRLFAGGLGGAGAVNPAVSLTPLPNKIPPRASTGSYS